MHNANPYYSIRLQCRRPLLTSPCIRPSPPPPLHTTASRHPPTMSLHNTLPVILACPRMSQANRRPEDQPRASAERLGATPPQSSQSARTSTNPKQIGAHRWKANHALHAILAPMPEICFLRPRQPTMDREDGTP
jgi:hypothetical protein